MGTPLDGNDEKGEGRKGKKGTIGIDRERGERICCILGQSSPLRGFLLPINTILVILTNLYSTLFIGLVSH